MWATRALQMAGNARRAKRLRDDVVVDLTNDGGKESDAKLLRVQKEKNQLEEEKRQWEKEKRQWEEDKGMLEMERNQAQKSLREHQDLFKCPVCLMLPREDKPVPCCPRGHLVCSTCKDQLIRQGGVSISFALKSWIYMNIINIFGYS